MTYRVDIGIACGVNQNHKWWSGIMGRLLIEQRSGIEIGQILTIGSALPDFNKSEVVGMPLLEQKKRGQLTDINRNEITKRFISGGSNNWKADWLFQIDDDVLFPEGALSNLLKLKKDFVAGLYFNPNPPKNPIAYFRNKDDIGYSSLYNYPYDSLVQVDSVGMGCTLINRSVFEKIYDGHEVWVRPNGSLLVYPKKNIKQWKDKHARPIESLTVYGEVAEYKMPLIRPKEDDNRWFPFYSMEYLRTEDHHFCELADNVGIKPWVDTRIVCEHIKPGVTMTYEDYREFVNERNGL